MSNPFEVAPPNVLQALMMGQQGYKQGREIATENRRTTALQQLMGVGQPSANPDYAGVAKTLAASGDIAGASQIAGLAKNLAGPESTDEIKEYNLSKQQGYKGTFTDWKTGLKKAGATNVSTQTNVNAAVNPVLKGVSDRFNEAVESADSSRSQIQSIHEARKALDDGAITGAFADQKLLLTKAASIFGLPQETVANTEVMRSALGNQVLAKAKQLGANPSNTDRDYIEKVVGGQINLDEKTIRRLLDMQEGWGRENIKRANTRAQQFMRAYPKELAPVAGMLNTQEPGPYQYQRPQQQGAAPGGTTKTGVKWGFE